jgi:hypothetical protein
MKDKLLLRLNVPRNFFIDDNDSVSICAGAIQKLTNCDADTPLMCNTVVMELNNVRPHQRGWFKVKVRVVSSICGYVYILQAKQQNFICHTRLEHFLIQRGYMHTGTNGHFFARLTL